MIFVCLLFAKFCNFDIIYIIYSECTIHINSDINIIKIFLLYRLFNLYILIVCFLFLNSIDNSIL